MHKRIILFPDKLTEETRLFIKSVYDTQCLLEDLNSQEADEILLRVAPKDVSIQLVKTKLNEVVLNIFELFNNKNLAENQNPIICTLASFFFKNFTSYFSYITYFDFNHF